ncbi:chemotaxis protein CheW [Roseomonas marmotae]|uniref:Chemotaxis protein CheW n=2 Tax=Roseomonas marmotae TaxID=2768161 RepID=A0ABS3KB12_9PROT|nr:chemotaxis protein CheW [Roseomonas marmotae]MBO1074192.1 chemotaxis protein CheW [Roseomonas marmotae]QTI78965.1 chemotaxis protein CheW [Roseomonas marmotae]
MTLSGQDPLPAGGEAQFLLFALAGQRCALPREAVRELLPLPRLSRPPSLPAALAGFVNLGGEPLPVLALAHLLGLRDGAAEEDGLYRHIVVVRDMLPGADAGLLVDRVQDLQAVPPGWLRPAPPEQSLNGCVAAGLAMPDGFVPVLDPARILLAQEQASLEELTRRASGRLREWTA